MRLCVLNSLQQRGVQNTIRGDETDIPRKASANGKVKPTSRQIRHASAAFLDQ